jgi:hypothetical protein
VARRPAPGSRRCRRPRAHGLCRGPRARASPETRAGDDRAEACSGAELPQVHAWADERARRLARTAPAAAPPGHAEDRGGRVGPQCACGGRAARPAEPRAGGARVFGRPSKRGGGRPRSRRRRLRPRTTSRQGQGRQGAPRPARRGGGPSARALSPRSATGAGDGCGERTVSVDARQTARHLDAAPRVRAPTPLAACLRHASNGRRGRPPNHPGAPRP